MIDYRAFHPAMTYHQFMLVAASYFLGSLPNGYLISLAVGGLDIRQRGSGNPGAANVYGVLGAGPALATLIADILKGFLPVLLVLNLYPGRYDIALFCAAAAIAGHSWMFFLRFRGGKAVATTAGVFLALLPVQMSLTFLLFSLTVWLSGHISAGSMLAAFVFPFIALATGAPIGATRLAFFSCILILIKHISNVGRLRSGSEADYDEGADLEKY